MSRTICIVGTDWAGPDPTWVRQPFLDGGRLHFDRTRQEDWANVWYELGELAQVDAIAIGCRGTFDPHAVASLPIAREAYRAARVQPRLTFWADTVGLPDITYNLDGRPFDFANDAHLDWAWEHYVKHFVDHFGDLPLERSPNGRVLICWWNIRTDNGHGFVNQHLAQRLLDEIDRRLSEMMLGGADHVVDANWLEYAPTLQAYGVHDWFVGHNPPLSAYSVRTYHGVTVGVTVPSFFRNINPEGNADTLRDALAAMREAHADYVLIESGTNFQEGAELMRDSTGNTHKLDAVREHVALTRPQTHQTNEDTMITGTFSLRRSERITHPSKPGYFTWPYPGTLAEEVFSCNPPDGHVEPRPKGTEGPFESGREEGNRAVFDMVAGYTFAFPLVD